jgi:hypothetical protein
MDDSPSLPSLPSVQGSLSSVSLEERCNNYTLARYHEAHDGRDVEKVGRWASYTFLSTMLSCPCGQPLPCPEHGDFPRRFFEIFPDDADYIACFRAKKLPYTSPHHLRAQSEAARAETQNNDLPLEPEGGFPLSSPPLRDRK